MKLLRKIFLDNLLEKLLALTLAISLAVTKRVDRVIRVKKMVSLELSYPDSRVDQCLPQQIELVIETLPEDSKFRRRSGQQIKPYRIQFMFGMVSTISRETIMHCLRVLSSKQFHPHPWLFSSTKKLNVECL